MIFSPSKFWRNEFSHLVFIEVFISFLLPKDKLAQKLVSHSAWCFCPICSSSPTPSTLRVVFFSFLTSFIVSIEMLLRRQIGFGLMINEVATVTVTILIYFFCYQNNETTISQCFGKYLLCIQLLGSISNQYIIILH